MVCTTSTACPACWAALSPFLPWLIRSRSIHRGCFMTSPRPQSPAATPCIRRSKASSPHGGLQWSPERSQVLKVFIHACIDGLSGLPFSRFPLFFLFLFSFNRKLGCSVGDRASCAVPSQHLRRGNVRRQDPVERLVETAQRRRK